MFGASNFSNASKIMVSTEQLLPNEIRISMKSSFDYQVRHVMETFDMGYSHCKIVGRGQAVERAFEVIRAVEIRLPGLAYDISETKSLNKQGMVVGEIHILISAGGAGTGGEGLGNCYQKRNSIMMANPTHHGMRYD